jgi:hypothetical protein
MIGDMAIALLEISVSVTGIMIAAGIYEYILCPLWDKWKERKIRG